MNNNPVATARTNDLALIMVTEEPHASFIICEDFLPAASRTRVELHYCEEWIMARVSRTVLHCYGFSC